MLDFPQPLILLLLYSTSLIIFFLGFFSLRIGASCLRVLSLGLHAIEVLTNYLASETEKQTSIKNISLTLFKTLFVLLFKLVLLFVLISLPFYAAYYFSFLVIQDWQTFLYSPSNVVFMLVSTVLVVVVFARRNIQQTKQKLEPEQAYSDSYRAMHNLYFASNFLQKVLYKLEQFLFSKRWQDTQVEQAVFICALPRSGTTILLEALNALPHAATYIYRDMPFIFSLVLWAKLSHFFKKQSEKKPRAHNDGLLINENSPEAFEEVLWLKFFPQKYTENRIYLWQESDETFSTFFKQNMQRLIYLRQAPQLEQGFYVSKNNANIARLPVLKKILPQALIIIPLRNPLEHAASLYQQHLNFLQQHKQNQFSKKYMADIGHFEFGELHKPISFPEFEKRTNNLKTTDADYWLAYWLSAYHYLASCEGIVWLSYTALCQNPEQQLSKLCELANINVNKDEIQHAAALITAEPESKQDNIFSEALSQEAQALYKTLLEKVI